MFPSVLCSSERLPHYKLGDLGLVPRQEQSMSASSTGRHMPSDRHTTSKKIPCHSVATQTVSAVKVCYLFIFVFHLVTK